jgi:hypothetical protein
MREHLLGPLATAALLLAAVVLTGGCGAGAAGAARTEHGADAARARPPGLCPMLRRKAALEGDASPASLVYVRTDMLTAEKLIQAGHSVDEGDGPVYLAEAAGHFTAFEALDRPGQGRPKGRTLTVIVTRPAPLRIAVVGVGNLVPDLTQIAPPRSCAAAGEDGG